jgi:hypothetical protein
LREYLLCDENQCPESSVFQFVRPEQLPKNPIVTLFAPLRPETKRGRIIAAALVLLGFLYILGALEVQVGALRVPEFPGWWLVAASAMSIALPPVGSSGSPCKRLTLKTIAVAGVGWFLVNWQGELQGVTSPLIGSLHGPAQLGSVPIRRVLLAELRLKDRTSLRALTGHGQNVHLIIDGFIHLPESGRYKLSISCDDHCTLEIGGERIAEDSGTVYVPFEAGTKELRLDYHQTTGGASLALEWDRPGFVELLPMRELVAGRKESVSADDVRARSLAVAIFLVLWTGWWVVLAVAVVSAGEARKLWYQRIADYWKRLSEDDEEEGTITISAADIAVTALFLFFGVLHQFAHLTNRPPYVLLDDDAGNIATFAAARDHPELFHGDEVLGAPELSRWYSTVHVPIVRALSRVTGDYGTAFVSLLGLHLFLQSMGFYLLGRVLFRSRYWALLLAVVALMPVDLNLAEFWGLYERPIPRFSFQALLPFVASAAYVWRRRPERWPVVMVAAGLLIYVHPVSAPAWGMALWLGFLAYPPPEWSWARRLTTMLSLGALFLAVSAPFLWHYVAHQEVGTAPSAPYGEIRRIIEARFEPGYLDLPAAILEFALVFGRIPGRSLIWLLASGGALLVLWLHRKERKSVVVVLLWVIGLVVTSVLLPMIDHQLASALHSFPLEYDLVRGLRYLVPFVLLFSLWPLAEISRRSRRQYQTRGVTFLLAAVGALLVSIWSYWHPPLSLGLARCWSTGGLSCGPSSDTAYEALEAIRRLTPPQAAILPTELPLAIRYYALRPVVYCYKDGGILSYADHQRLLEWNERKRELSKALLIEEPAARMDRLLSVAEGLGARYLFVGATLTDDVPRSRHEFIWANEGYALLEVHTPSASDRR